MAQPHAITLANYQALYENSTVITTLAASACSSIGNVEGMNQYGPYIIVIDMQILRDQVFYVMIYIVSPAARMP